MFDGQRLWMRLCNIVLEGFSMIGRLILSPFEARSEWTVQEPGSGVQGGGMEMERRRGGCCSPIERRLLLTHSTVDGGECHARMGSDDAFNGCRSGAKVHRCSYRLLPARVPYHSLSGRHQCWE